MNAPKASPSARLSKFEMSSNVPEAPSAMVMACLAANPLLKVLRTRDVPVPSSLMARRWHLPGSALAVTCDCAFPEVEKLLPAARGKYAVDEPVGLVKGNRRAGDGSMPYTTLTGLAPTFIATRGSAGSVSAR